MKRWQKMFFLFSGITTSSLVAFSCTRPSQIKPANHYVQSFNLANPYSNGSLKLHENKKVTTQIQKSLFAPIFKKHAIQNLVIDKVNSLVSRPSFEFWRLYLAEYIKVHFDNSTELTYSNDDYDLEQKYDLKLNQKNYVLPVLSQKINSINNAQFIENLNKAQKIEIKLKDLSYQDYTGKNTEHKLQASDLLKNITPEIANLFEQQYGVKLKAKNATLIIKNPKHLAGNFIVNQMIENLLFNPTPVSTQKEINYKNDFYLGYYIPKVNQINKIELIKNTNSADNIFNSSQNNLNQIEILYNPTPLDEETFRVQQLRSYRQNLISEANFNTFNTSQKSDILQRSSQYGVREILNQNSLSSNQEWLYTINLEPNKKSKFNKVFENLFFNSQYSYKLKWLISRLYSKFSIMNAQGYPYFWNSLALPNLQIKNNLNEDSDFTTLDKAYNWATREIFSNKQGYQNIFYEDLKINYFENTKLLDFSNQLKHPFFNKLIEQINEIVNQYWIENKYNKNEKIIFVLPILNTLTSKQKEILKNYSTVLNEINHFDVTTQNVSKEEMQQYNWIYSLNKLNYEDNSISTYIKTLWDTSEILPYLSNQYLNENYPVLNSLKELNLENVLSFINEKNLYEQIILLNELDNLIPLPISVLNYDQYKSLDKKMIQKYYEYPTNRSGIVSFEDITY